MKLWAAGIGQYRWEGKRGGQGEQTDLPDHPRSPKMWISLTGELIEEFYRTRMPGNILDDEGEGWGCRWCRNTDVARLLIIQVVKSRPECCIV